MKATTAVHAVNAIPVHGHQTGTRKTAKKTGAKTHAASAKSRKEQFAAYDKYWTIVKLICMGFAFLGLCMTASGAFWLDADRSSVFQSVLLQVIGIPMFIFGALMAKSADTEREKNEQERIHWENTHGNRAPHRTPARFRTPVIPITDHRPGRARAVR